MARFGRAYPAPTGVIAAPISTLPPAPMDPRATEVGPTQVTVVWDPPEVGALAYGIYLDGVQQGSDQADTSITLTGLVEGRTYLIEVDAVAVDGRSDRVQLVVTTPDVTAPSVPAALTLAARTRTTLTVTWEPSGDNVSVAGYGLYLDGAKQGGDQAGTVFTFAGLVADHAYVVGVDAADATGNRSAAAVLEVRTAPDLPPSAPPGLHLTDLTYTSFAVAWDEASDEDPVTGYDVALDGTVVGTNQAERSAFFSGLVENTTHTVQVWAVDQLGQRTTVPAELVVTTLDDTPPTVPELVVEAGEESITVAWTASTDDFGVVGYRVDLDGEPVHVTPGVDYTVDGPITRRHTITGLVSGVDYRVRVAALDALGQQSADNTTVVPTVPTPFLAIESPVYRLGEWAGNVRDEHNVDWVVEDATGWASTPPVRPRAATLGGTDGAWASAGQYGSRIITLKGTAVAASRAGMLAAKQRIIGVLEPREFGLLRVEDALRTRQARVRLIGKVETVDVGSLAFSWSFTLKAPDPRRYATVPVAASAVVASLPGEASLTLTLAGTYPQIPARMRLYGPIRDWTVTHQESGTVMRAMTGSSLPADPRYSLGFDLATRQVWAYVPPEVYPEPRPGRAMVAHLPAWFQLLPGLNTITLAGQPVDGVSGAPRLVVEAYDAWV
ncbi:fibronectin type III domain-containing protein [Planomonospora sp. ID82291]|uniref:fibronectin type III domain-containing protein n=1 Tax=Planomonospora sp. ID82291 TaxID=2738136 RepID=UPI0018C3DDAF|nr:fibronectin type III domain-containing protein [Planomonospora sp. ID82291]MBG0819020.1 fibronectin type III domain-containing protein [Planomonospora sp. ID82291]